jgi:hypothetical protein
MSRRLAARPGNANTAECEQLIERGVLDYLAGIGTFQSWDNRCRGGLTLSLAVEEVRQ